MHRVWPRQLQCHKQERPQLNQVHVQDVQKELSRAMPGNHRVCRQKRRLHHRQRPAGLEHQGERAKTVRGQGRTDGAQHGTGTPQPEHASRQDVHGRRALLPEVRGRVGDRRDRDRDTGKRQGTRRQHHGEIQGTVRASRKIRS